MRAKPVGIAGATKIPSGKNIIHIPARERAGRKEKSMGCDIHVFTECKSTKRGREGTWENTDHWQLNYLYGTDDDEREYDVVPVYEDRNYELFAYLADVRNNGDIVSFDFDRGLPSDVSDATRNVYDAHKHYYHTPGWVTLRELKEAASKIKEINRQGFVRNDQYERFRRDGVTPTFWCQSVGDDYLEDYKFLQWTDECHCFDHLIEGIEKRKIEEFWLEYADEEKRNSRDDDIRIVFWFDS